MRQTALQFAVLCLTALLLFCCSGCTVFTNAIDELDFPDPPDWGDNTDQSGEPEYTEIDDLVELRDFLWERVESGDENPFFRYLGDPDDLDGQTIARILCAYYIVIRQIPDARDVWQVEYTPFPGDRIVAAYQSGDRSALSEDERTALQIAEEAVQEGLAQSSDRIALELYLHDWLCRRVTYYDGSTKVDEGAVLSHLTALGALLEGKANCQGYTDAFYVLASIAGFEVSRQCCDTANGGHCFNTIYLEDGWYVVDVTFDDDFYADDGQSYTDYRLFNAGRAECSEYTWPEEYEYHTLADEGGAAYYYNLSADTVGTAHGYTKRYETLTDMANGVVEQWKDGRTVFHLMLSDRTATWEDLNALLGTRLEAEGKAYSFRIWSFTVGEHTYFYIHFR